jgi:hypothetical protein
MIISIKYFDARNREYTVDEIIANYFNDKDSKILIPELNKTYTANKESIAELKKDIIKFYGFLPEGKTEQRDAENSNSTNTKDLEPDNVSLAETVKRSKSLGLFISILMCLGGILSIIIGISQFKENPVLAGVLFGSSISTFILASLLFSIVSSIYGLHKKMAILEKKLFSEDK